MLWAGVDHIACQIPHVNVGRASACVREPSSKSGFLGVGISRCENSPQQQPKAPLPRCPQRMMCVSGSRLACAARLLVCSMAWVGLSNTSFHGWHGQDQIPCLSRLRRAPCLSCCTAHSAQCPRGKTRAQEHIPAFAADSTATQESWLVWIVSIGSMLAECAGSCSGDAQLLAGHSAMASGEPMGR